MIAVVRLRNMKLQSDKGFEILECVFVAMKQEIT